MLRSISLVQFKNYTNRIFDFNKRIIGIVGNNGVGKTNILDAIYYICFTKSYFSSTDSINVQQGTKGFRIEGLFDDGENEARATCIIRENGKKEFAVNDEQYDKFSQHIGRYPCVVIAPDDAVLITGGSEERRNFLDALLAQLDGNYLQNLIQYNKILQQRNSLLKASAESERLDQDLLNILNNQLSQFGNCVFEKRSQFLVSFLPKVKRQYTAISQIEEALALVYDSRLLEVSFEELLNATQVKDELLQRTTAGIHRDDIIFTLNNQPFKNIASQGQRKSLLFALKLTELEIIIAERQTAPLLLLDDVFEKLDEERIGNLLEKVCMENQGQVFITDTNKDRLTSHLSAIKADYDLISL